MQIVIDIDEESYKEIKKIVADGNDTYFTDKLIANGTLLHTEEVWHYMIFIAETN